MTEKLSLLLFQLRGARQPDSVPQAIYCFLISKHEEDALKNCILIGGDTDTIGCMCGAISEAYYANEYLSKFEDEYLYWMVDPNVVDLLRRFYGLFGFKKFIKQTNN